MNGRRAERSFRSIFQKGTSSGIKNRISDSGVASEIPIHAGSRPRERARPIPRQWR